MLSLREQLQAIKAESAAMITTEAAAAMKRAFDELKQNDVLEKALRGGDTAPGFALPDPEGQIVSLEELLKKGPLVVHFYRGKW
jgi:hypothetical protein